MNTVAFDVDGTLIGLQQDTPRYEVIKLFQLLEKFGFKMYIWSSGGMDYAEHWAFKLGLKAEIASKGGFIPDIAVDDEDVKLGKINIKV